MSQNITMPELAKRLGPDGMSIADEINLLAEENPIVQHGTTVEGNLADGHQFSEVITMPTAGLRNFNAPASFSKGVLKQKKETTSLIQMYSDIDVDLANLGGNVNALREQENGLCRTSMNEKMCDLLFYGNPATEEGAFQGLANRYIYESTPTNAYTANTLLQSSMAGAETDCLSFWWICWSPLCTFLITPKGSGPGLEVNDMGREQVPTITNVSTAGSTTGVYYVYRYEYKWKVGLGIRDPRQNVRLQFSKADIDWTTAGSGTAQDIHDLFVDGFHRIHNPNMGKIIGYCSREMHAFLWKMAGRLTSSSTFSRTEDLENGGPMLRVMGKPVYSLDCLDATEAALN